MTTDEYVYLGKKVDDTGEQGLDSVEECIGIANTIYDDYVNGDIDYNLAVKRLNFLKLVVKRDSKLDTAEKQQCYDHIDEVREELMEMHESDEE